MHKIGHVLIVIGLVTVVYLLMMVVMPVVNDLIVTANTTMTASSNLSDYPGTQGFMISSTWWLWFVPASLGTVAIILIMKT